MNFRFKTLVLVGLIFSVQPSSAQELLSAKVNRLDQMLQSCQNNLSFSKDECGCIFTKSLETDISNVDLSFYFYAETDQLSYEKQEALHNLTAVCTDLK